MDLLSLLLSTLFLHDDYDHLLLTKLLYISINIYISYLNNVEFLIRLMRYSNR